jgi:hypothetical protein
MSRYETSSSAIGGWYKPAGYTALPARTGVSEPQHELIHALASHRGAKPSQTQGDLLMAAKVRRQASGQTAGPPCDRCDGPHRTEQCVHFRSERDDHFDSYEKLDQGDGPEDVDAAPIIVQGRVVPQPGDGSCLFHSLGFSLGEDPRRLRQEVTRFVEQNPHASIAGTELHKWVHWDSGLDVRSYAKRLASPGSWGGALEVAVVAQIHGACVSVFERHAAGYKRIAMFGESGPAKRHAHLLYGGRVHYDALQLTA